MNSALKFQLFYYFNKKMKFQKPILKFVQMEGRTSPMQYAPSTYLKLRHKKDFCIECLLLIFTWKNQSCSTAEDGLA